MKKILIFLTIFFSTIAVVNADEMKRIVVGNKDAKITIIAFESLTCSHCADFSNNIFPEIKEKYIDTGKIKFEVRPFALNAIDLNAFKLLHCTDEKDFFAMEKLLFQEII